LFSLSVRFLLYSPMMASTPFLHKF
jgi:hypothetical protein